jgi:outer membrane protein OmpA-like peptidoglycan-associated protein
MNRTGKIAGLLLVGLVGLGLTGCNKVNKADYEAAMQENSELRDRLAAEQKNRQESESRLASVEQERNDLAAQTDKTRSTGGARSGGGGGDWGPGVSVSQRGADTVVSVAGDVLFDSGKTTLKSTAKKTLDKVASSIKSGYSGHQIRVEGYTDSDPLIKTKGKWGNNERLSGERALAVEEYLVSKGLSKDQIYYAGFGPSHPRANKKDSRRVEIVILAAHD